jgi:hypothetical protein
LLNCRKRIFCARGASFEEWKTEGGEVLGWGGAPADFGFSWKGTQAEGAAGHTANRAGAGRRGCLSPGDRPDRVFTPGSKGDAPP